MILIICYNNIQESKFYNFLFVLRRWKSSFAPAPTFDRNAPIIIVLVYFDNRVHFYQRNIRENVSDIIT